MSKNQKLLFWILVSIAIVTTLPFIGLTEFYSKGEPREAVVALSMLKDGNWILPVNNGGDIPYKPPFFHWLIALLSLPRGHVSEFTSRLPSALSLIAMVVAGYLFNSRRKNAEVAFVAALFTLTAFEVHRAGMACRVDMVLTACLVGSYWLLYRWWERGMRGFPLWAVLCMSGAMLTKGPIGVVLPCLVMGVLMLVKGVKWWKTAAWLTLFGLAACVLPALWYVAAYHRGGDHFLQLVMEENLGRFTGTMSYDSHNHAIPYNFITLIVGWVPWTLLALFSLFPLHWHRRVPAVKGWLQRVRNADAFTLFTWLGFVVTLVFYCIPSSKRSVYLLPCYPFMALLMAQYISRMIARRRCALNLFVATMAVTGVLVVIAFVVVHAGVVPDTVFHGRHAAENIRMLHALENLPWHAGNIVLLALPVLVGISSFYTAVRRLRPDYWPHLLVGRMFLNVFVIFMMLDGVILPAVLNVKSDRPLAEMIDRRYPDTPVYQYVSTDMLHFFGTNFYANDRLRQFELDKPSRGVLMIAAKDREAFMGRHRDYRFAAEWKSTQQLTEVKDTIYLYRFNRSSTK